jgi:hypothetical protein
MGDSITNNGNYSPPHYKKGDDAGTHEMMTRARAVVRVGSFSRGPVSVTLSALRLTAMKMAPLGLAKTY